MAEPTDYARIAARYDQNPDRHRIAPEPAIAALRGEGGGARVRALDVACGTGNWLATQRAAFAGEVELAGADPSSAMLDVARGKLGSDVALTQAPADALPYDAASFDLVISTFAFHHFPDRPRAWASMLRCVRPGGRLVLRNICPEHMPRAWVYAYFEGAAAIDAARFPSARALREELAAIASDVQLEVRSSYVEKSVASIRAIAALREVSELAVLDDARFAAGLARLDAALAANPRATYLDEVAILELTARR